MQLVSFGRDVYDLDKFVRCDDQGGRLTIHMLAGPPHVLDIDSPQAKAFARYLRIDLGSVELKVVAPEEPKKP